MANIELPNSKSIIKKVINTIELPKYGINL